MRIIAKKTSVILDIISIEIEDIFRPHCCRHWFAMEPGMAGMHQEIIQDMYFKKGHAVSS